MLEAMSTSSVQAAPDGSLARLEKILVKSPELGELLADLRPQRGLAIILRDPIEGITKGGIIIPEMYRDDAKEKKHPVFKATVLAVGPFAYASESSFRCPACDHYEPLRTVDPIVRPGDRVWIGRWGLTNLSVVKSLGVPNVFTMESLNILGFVEGNDEEDPLHERN